MKLNEEKKKKTKMVKLYEQDVYELTMIKIRNNYKSIAEVVHGLMNDKKIYVFTNTALNSNTMGTSLYSNINVPSTTSSSNEVGKEVKNE
ncbi:MAG: hypothetical protein QXV17_11985 [Candidatus Micrarchaeaceae archaeon]